MAASHPARNGPCSLPNQPHCSPVYGTGGIIDVVSAALASLFPECRDAICGPHKYCAMQPVNIMLNSLVLERHVGYKAIHAYNYDGKVDYVFKIVVEIELLGGRFLLHAGLD